MKYTILGAGLSGLSASYHLGHKNCVIFEKDTHAGGHIYSELREGFIWDDGPHVSFTESEYVKELFAKSVNYNYLEYEVKTANYYKGHWIPHPAQSNLFAVPEPLRTKCLDDFLKTRGINKNKISANYNEWLELAFGSSFTKNFPGIYTRKYWTVEPELLTTDWVGQRMYLPKIEEVKEGYLKPLNRQTHYIKKVRYPELGGYYSFANELIKGANINYVKSLACISFKEKKLFFSDGTNHNYEKLISTIPLPILIIHSDLPNEVKNAARILSCSSLLLVNVIANHSTQTDYNWIYVYDKDKYSTRINCTELMSPKNGIKNKTGIQVEVYFSKYKPLKKDPNHILDSVKSELVEMGLIKKKESILHAYHKWVPWANIIFDFNRKKALDKIYNSLENFGLVREVNDLEATTDWKNKITAEKRKTDIFFAGRYGQWKYYWSDDCVLRGKDLLQD